MSTATIEGEQRVSLGDVRWETLESLLRDLGESRGRLAYDQGLLEIMSPSFEHDVIANLIGRLVEALTEELDIPIRSTRSTTLKRPDQRRAVEPDASYYIAHEVDVRRQHELDLQRDPPPDLIVEVDISRSSRARIPVYAALEVPEIWQWLGLTLRVLRLQSHGAYVPVERSEVFPMLPLEGLRTFLELRHEKDETEIVKAFRAWVKSGFPAMK